MLILDRGVREGERYEVNLKGSTTAAFTVQYRFKKNNSDVNSWIKVVFMDALDRVKSL